MPNPIIPVSASLPAPLTPGIDGLSLSAKAFALNPELAAQAMTQTTSGNTNNAVMSLNASKALNPLNGPKDHTDAQLKQVSQNFESIFIQMMLKEMRNSVEKSNLFGNSQATQFFESMRDEEIAKQLSASGGIGIGAMVYTQLKQATGPHIKNFS